MAKDYQVGITPERLKGTKTEQNLHTALAGEAQAYLRYKWFEEKAKTDGFIDVSEIFCETAHNEKEHAEIWFKYLGGYSTTEKNLETAASGEHFEWSSMYSDFAREAREEGFAELAFLFEKVGAIEKMHEERYNSYRQRILDGKMFASDDENTLWICLNCGNVVQGKNPPPMCPVCKESQGYFKNLSE